MKEYRSKIYVDSIVPFPQKPLLAQDFEGCIPQLIKESADEPSLIRDTENVLNGNVSLRMMTKVTTPAADDEVQATFNVPAVKSRFTRLQVNLQHPVNDPNGQGYIIIKYSVKVMSKNIIVTYATKYTQTTGVVELETEPDVWEEIGTLPITMSGYWTNFEILFDTIEKRLLAYSIGQDEIINITKKPREIVYDSPYSTLDIILGNLATDRSGILISSIVFKPE